MAPTLLPTVDTSLTDSSEPQPNNDNADPDDPVFGILLEQSFDNGRALRDVASPQRRAYQWVARRWQGQRMLQQQQSGTNSRLLQQYAMVTLYYATNFPNYIAWKQSDNWLLTDNECTWFSRHFGTIQDEDTACDSEGNLVSLSLGYNGLRGELPAELGHLTHLRYLQLGGNDLSGTLPRTLTRLTALEHFLVNDNQFSGPVPTDDSESAFWKDLQVWNFQNNQFTGTIPSNVLRGMTSLRIWNLHDNEFHGALPGSVMQSLSSSLTMVDLSHNRFSGPLPDEWGSLTKLVILRLGENALTSVTPNIVNMSSLRTLSLPFNRLQGPLQLEREDGPSPGLENLVDVDVSHNELTGTLPSFLYTRRLSEIDLSHNIFSGEIPETIGGLDYLMVLDLHANRLEGRIPASMQNLSSLVQVRFDDNFLTGSIPEEVCDSIEASQTTLYSDCGDDVSGEAAPKVTCPPGNCCTYCCAGSAGCRCVFANTDLEYLC